jgi:Ca-activated chloride channel family protein
VYTIGIGNAGDFNAGILREIAQGTGAEFFSANSIQGIKDIYIKLIFSSTSGANKASRLLVLW